MKKLISLLAALSVVSACSFGALATDFTVETKDSTGSTVTSTLTATDVAEPTAYTKGTDGLYTVDLTTVAGTQEQTTILAVEGTTISVGSIKFIDQSATPSFSFDMDDPAEQVYVLAGGSAISPTYVGYIATASTEPETFTISGTVSGYAGATLPTIVVSDGTNSYTATVDSTGAFTVDVPVLESGSYTLTATKTSHLSYTKANITEATTVNPIVKVGDVDGTANIGVIDIGLIAGQYNTNSEQEGFIPAYDVDETGAIGVIDIGLVAGNYNSTSITE